MSELEEESPSVKLIFDGDLEIDDDISYIITDQPGRIVQPIEITSGWDETIKLFSNSYADFPFMGAYRTFRPIIENEQVKRSIKGVHFMNCIRVVCAYRIHGRIVYRRLFIKKADLTSIIPKIPLKYFERLDLEFYRTIQIKLAERRKLSNKADWQDEESKRRYYEEYRTERRGENLKESTGYISPERAICSICRVSIPTDTAKISYNSEMERIIVCASCALTGGSKFSEEALDNPEGFIQDISALYIDGERLKINRVGLGLTLERLSEELGCSLNTYRKYEKSGLHSVKIEDAIKLAKIFNNELALENIKNFRMGQEI